MGILLVVLMGSLAIFGSSNAAKQDLVKEDMVLFDSLAPKMSLEQKKSAIRVYFVERDEYQKIELIPTMTKKQINELYNLALASFK